MSKRFGRNQKRKLNEQLHNEYLRANKLQSVYSQLYRDHAAVQHKIDQRGGPYDVGLYVNIKRDVAYGSVQMRASIKDSHCQHTFSREEILCCDRDRRGFIQHVAERIAHDLVREFENYNRGVNYSG